MQAALCSAVILGSRLARSEHPLVAHPIADGNLKVNDYTGTPVFLNANSSPSPSAGVDVVRL